ncbi:phosphatidylglycerophosphate phosphatase PTPMT1 isoform X3 [Populus alba]|uniref:phosphatidylglycerophosphate phosphatase PTPMT1 isoform X3 n=1 Tax=Populus alba TaxID=43335 RepID=UPI003CC736CB
MYIEEIKEGDQDENSCRNVVVLDAKKVLFILLGAVPFPTDVRRLKKLGVSGVVTLNEPYETLVPTSLYHAHDIDHLVIPTRDYLFAPSFTDICQAVDFIHNSFFCVELYEENASLGKTTYVHCKAGRGRSTTIVLCYLVEHRHMLPKAAYEHVRSIRPRVLLVSSQWQAVQDYYLLKVKKTSVPGCTVTQKALDLPTRGDEKQDTASFDDGSAVLVTESELDGYDASCDSGLVGNDMLAEHGLACKVQFASRAAISRLSCLWLGGHPDQKSSMKKPGSSIGGNQLSSIAADIQVY